MPTPNEITFSVDHLPTGGHGGTSPLTGWAISTKAQVVLQVVLRGEVVFEQPCGALRPDVFAAFPHNPFSLLSGFEVPFPQELLALLPPGSLLVRATDGVTNLTVWEWSEGFVPSLTLDAAGRVRAYFRNQPALALFRRNTVPPQKRTLVVYLDCSNRGPFVSSSLGALSHLSSVKRLYIQIADSNQQAELEERLRQHPSINAGTVVFRNGTAESSTPVEYEPSDIFLHLDDRLDLEWMDLEALVTDYERIPGVSLLMPTIYGEGGGPIPLGQTLRDLRTTTADKHNTPRLFPSTSAEPVFVTCGALLNAVSSSLGIAPGTLSPMTLIRRSHNLVFYRDLRQPVSSDGAFISEFSKDPTELLASVLRCFERLPSSTGNPAAVFVLPEAWRERSADRGKPAQALHLMRQAVADGYDVAVVVDGTWRLDGAFAEFSVWPLEVFSKHCASLSAGSILLACRWDALRAAFLLQYQFELPVGCLLQEDHRHIFERWQRDRRQHAVWAYRGEFVPVCASAELLERLREDLVGASEALLFSSPAAVIGATSATRNERTVTVVLDPDHVYSESRGEFLRELVLALKSQGFQVTLTGYEANDHSLRPLLSIVDRTLVNPSTHELWQLYRESTNVLFVDSPYGALPSAHEAIACGCFVVVNGIGLLDKRLVDSTACVVVEPSPAAFVAACRTSFSSATSTPTAAQPSAGTGLAKQLVDASTAMTDRLRAERANAAAVSIIVPIYNALDITISCIRTVIKYRAQDEYLVLVNDASDAGTSAWLREVAAQHDWITLIEQEKNGGFVQACHAGLQAADPSHDIVLLNSDVILTREALARVRRAASARPRIGLVSALSTNSPHLKVPTNVGDSLESAAVKIAGLRSPTYPTIVTPEGQLLFIRRWALRRFGFFDPVYNRGFCEESDLCMRMFLSGVDMVCADDAYIFHKKSASFGDDESALQKSKNRPIFDGRWGRYYLLAYQIFTKRAPIEPIRKAYASLASVVELPTEPFALREEHRNFSKLGRSVYTSAEAQSVLGDADVVFILPSAIFGGGSLSVLQHVNELLLRGVRARVISLKEPQIRNYPLLAPVISVSVDQLFELDWSNQIVVATFWSTAYLVRGLTYRYPELRGYYYIQDYEPWFYSYPDEFHAVNQAKESYSLGLHGVVKTEFLRDTVLREHNVSVDLISPGLDRGTFYPGEQHLHIGRPRLAALYRPRTKRRGNEEALSLIRALLHRLPEVEVTLFGSKESIPVDLEQRVNFVGELTPAQVAELYRRTDVVMDLSYWHGFGRMGLEGMACGAVPLLSQSGGVLRYAVDGENSFVVRSDDLPNALERLILLLSDRSQRMQMRDRALSKAAEFSEQRATDDWISVWSKELRDTRPEPMTVPLPTARPSTTVTDRSQM